MQPTAKLSQIPLVDMYYEAMKAGVPLKDWDEISVNQKLFAEFQCHPQLIHNYNNWLANHGVADDSHVEQIKAHTRQYVQWRGSLLKKGGLPLENQRFYIDAGPNEQKELLKANQELENFVTRIPIFEERMKILEENRVANKRFREQQLARNGLPPEPREEQRISEIKELYNETQNNTLLPACSKRLFENHVHDSIAHFGFASGNDYLKYRKTFNIESSQAALLCESK